jgi:DNA repair protein RadC
MDYSQEHNIDSLTRLIGARATKRLYRGLLAPLFVPTGECHAEHETLAVARELVMRLLQEEVQREGVLSAPAAVRDYLRLLFAGEQREIFVALFLDTRHRLIAAEKLFYGTLSQTAVYPREVVKRTLALNAGAVIFAHNHPSGVAEPSLADQTLTDNLKRALAFIDVRVLDHFIIGEGTALSFAERGML